MPCDGTEPRPPGRDAGGLLRPPPLARDVIRRLDAAAVRDFAIPGLILMENAGEGCARVIEELVAAPGDPVAPPFHVICGFGNNAGDGFVIARHLVNRGHEVTVHLTGGAGRIAAGSDAGVNLEIIRRMGVPILEPDRGDGGGGGGADAAAWIARATAGGTIVDAIFGSGLSRPVGPPQKDWIAAMNASGRPVIAVDIPSGLDADSGAPLGIAVRAAHTVTFVAPKLGFGRGEGPALTGTVHVVGISIPRALLEPHCTRSGGRKGGA